MADESPLRSVQTWPLHFLDEKLGRRVGFAVARVSKDAIAIVGGACHFDANLNDRPDLDRFSAVPLSQILKLTLTPSQPGSKGSQEIFSSDLLPINESASGTFPPPRSHHSATVLAPSGEPVIVIFGGRLFDGMHSLSLKRCASVWCCDLKGGVRWFEPKAVAPSPAPAPRWMHASTCLTPSSLLIHGGEDAVLLADLWLMHLGRGESTVWTRPVPVGAPPAARKGHSLTAIGNSQAVLFGGETSHGAANDLWLLQLSESGTRVIWSQLAHAPSPRAVHCAIPLAIREVHGSALKSHLLVFGGGKNFMSFDFSHNRWTESTDQETAGAVHAEFFSYPVPERVVPVSPTILLLSSSGEKLAVKGWLASLAGFDVRGVKADYSLRKQREALYNEVMDFKPTNTTMKYQAFSEPPLWGPNCIRRLLELFVGTLGVVRGGSHDAAPVLEKTHASFHGDVVVVEILDHAITYDEAERTINGDTAIVPILSRHAAQWTLLCVKDAQGSVLLCIINPKLASHSKFTRGFRFPVARFTKASPELLIFLRLARRYSSMNEHDMAELIVRMPNHSTAVCFGRPNLAGLDQCGTLGVCISKSFFSEGLSWFEYARAHRALLANVSGAKEGKRKGFHFCIGRGNGANLGVLIYYRGRLVRRLTGRFPSQNSPDAAVSVILDVHEGLTVDPTFTDFVEAAEDSQAWQVLTEAIYDLCDEYLNADLKK